MRTTGYEVDEIRDPAGYVFSLNNGRTRAVLSEAGGGMPPINYIVSSGPYQDGATLRGFRLGERAYILLVRWQGCSRDQYWQYRAKLIDWLRPNRQVLGELAPLTLRKYLTVNGRDIARDLYVMPAQGPEFAARDPGSWDEFGFSETVRLVAHDPTWYDAAQTTVDLTPASADSLVMPFTFPITFGSGIVSDSETIAYGGTWAAYPTITITGPIEGPQVRNVTTGELIALDYAVAAGEEVAIDLAYGAKTVTNNLGDNLIGELTNDSDLATWHLEPAPGAPDGNNQINFAGSGATGATMFAINWFDRYVGI